MIQIRHLTEQDFYQVNNIDLMSGFCVSQWLDTSDYAWGIFEKQKLIGYCTTGYADDTIDIIEYHPAHTCDSILISDVYILPEYRHMGYGTKLVVAAIRSRWESDKKRNAVFLVPMSSSLIQFYRKIGFKKISNDDPNDAMYLSINNLTQI